MCGKSDRVFDSLKTFTLGLKRVSLSLPIPGKESCPTPIDTALTARVRVMCAAKTALILAYTDTATTFGPLKRIVRPERLHVSR